MTECKIAAAGGKEKHADSLDDIKNRGRRQADSLDGIKNRGGRPRGGDS